MNLRTLIAMGLAMAAAGGIAHVLVEPYVSGEIKAKKRRAALRPPASKRGTERQSDAAQRRKQIAERLRELEARGKHKTRSVETRMTQAGVSWSRNGYIAGSAATGALCGILIWLAAAHFIAVIAAAAVGGLGVPAWLLDLLRKRRLKKFVDEFPNAIDVIIRGIKAGLPLGDCLRAIAAESAEPVRSEFRQIVEAQAMGFSTSEAVERLDERVPVAEARFFAIVISIQQKTGGNLAEALGNLSAVLRERKKMKGKIKAMSSEAKASAYIIGTLPFFVSASVYATSPKYIELLWTTETGELVLGACALWMAIGIIVMKNMINFDI